MTAPGRPACPREGAAPVAPEAGPDRRKHPAVTAVYITMFVITLLALAACAVVAVGMQGIGRDRAPRLANGFAEAARHMNGDAEPPQALLDLIPDQVGGVRH